MTGTSFRGNKGERCERGERCGSIETCGRGGGCGKCISAGFSLVGTLWVLLALSFVSASVLSAIKLSHDFILRDAGQFYEALREENEKYRNELRRMGYREERNEVD